MAHPSKCEHSVYWPAADKLNLGCQLCNPAGLGEGSSPVISRTESEYLREALQYCTKCGNIRTFSGDACRVCHQEFPHDQQLYRMQSTAHRKRPGMCPICFSTTHYETPKSSIWECADCGEKYKAPKIIHEATG